MRYDERRRPYAPRHASSYVPPVARRPPRARGRAFAVAAGCCLVALIGAALLVLHGRATFPTAPSLQSVYIQRGFPSYDLYASYFAKTKGYRVTDAPNADIVIAQTITGTYAQKQTIYDQVFVLTEDFQNLNSALTADQFTRLLADSAHLALDQSAAAYDSALRTTSDPLSYLAQDHSRYAIIPFEQLTNRYRTVDINGNSPIRRNFDEGAYPLKVQYTIASKSPFSADLSLFLSQHTYANYDKSAIHTIIMTGTTALGRGEYFGIAKHGTAYPALYVASIMKDADITEVSDEVSYVPNCTQQVGTLQFCALPFFLQTLTYAGVNLVELTGNHNNDFGAQYSAASIQTYTQSGIKHFGGGLNDQDARNPALFTLGTTRFAFLGYNEPGPEYAFATPTQSGAARLDVDHLKADIQKAKLSADVVFVDVQWENEDNEYPSQSQIDISNLAIDAGADVVTGSSGHRPEGMAFYKNKTIFYGLGNLFFDQMENLDTRQNVILRHTFYGKNLVSSELIPTLLFDYCQPQPVTGADAQAIFDQVFQASTNVP